MRTFTLRREMRLSRGIDEVFAFFADAGNLAEITPPWLGFTILTPRPIAMREGALIDYRLRLRGIPIRWRSEITEWDPPHVFTDEQRRGPYRRWIHRHRFRAEGSVTWVGDEVSYAVLGGAWVERWLVRPDVHRIFDYRGEVLRRRFGAAPAEAAPTNSSPSVG